MGIDPDTLNTRQIARIVDLLSEGKLLVFRQPLTQGLILTAIALPITWLR